MQGHFDFCHFLLNVVQWHKWHQTLPPTRLQTKNIKQTRALTILLKTNLIGERTLSVPKILFGKSKSLAYRTITTVYNMLLCPFLIIFEENVKGLAVWQRLLQWKETCFISASKYRQNFLNSKKIIRIICYDKKLLLKF